MNILVHKQIIKKILKTRSYCKYKNKLYWNNKNGYEYSSQIIKTTKNKFYIEDKVILKKRVFDLDDYSNFNQWDEKTINYFVDKGWLPKTRPTENILEEWSGRI